MTLVATAEAAGLALFRRVWRRRCLDALHALRDAAHSSTAAVRTKATTVHKSGGGKQRGCAHEWGLRIVDTKKAMTSVDAMTRILI